MERQAPGPGRFVLLAAVLWVVAILAVRLLLTGGWGWAVFAVGAPILLVLLRLATNWPVALLLMAFFVCTTLALRYVLATPQLGWSIVLLGVVLSVTMGIAWRVASTLVLDVRARRNSR